MFDHTDTDVAAARKLLEMARDDLDVAVAALPGVEDDDNAMATPALLPLLLRVVKAKHHLSGVELLRAATIAPPPRHTAPSA